MHKASIQKLLTPAFQARVHCYREEEGVGGGEEEVKEAVA